jgi:hypothetical protein
VTVTFRFGYIESETSAAWRPVWLAAPSSQAPKPHSEGFPAMADESDEFAPLHSSITSSARSRVDGGTARPSAVAVLRFTAISNFVGNCTGDRPACRP